MSDINGTRKDVEHRMGRAVEVLLEEFGGLRTGRASTSLLDPIQVILLGKFLEKHNNRLIAKSMPFYRDCHRSI